MWRLSSPKLSLYPWVCLCWDLWMWRCPILATQDDSQDQRFGHLCCESSLGDALSALEDLWLSPLHTADQPHLAKKSPCSLQREPSWGMARSLSPGLPSSPAGLALITYAHNPWLVHVIHQPRPRPLAPESPLLTCLLGGSWVAMATLIFSWQLGLSDASKSLFSHSASFSVHCFLSSKALHCLCLAPSMALCLPFLPFVSVPMLRPSWAWENGHNSATLWHLQGPLKCIGSILVQI